MIQIQGLRKSFKVRGEVIRAVDGVTFEARDGEITGLLGPNGAGKTTTLRMPVHADDTDEGRLLVDGLDPVAQPDDVRRRLGVLPDARGLYKRLTARENIAYFGRLHGIRRTRSAPAASA